MAKFDVRAKDPTGKDIKVQFDANSENEARAKAQASRLQVISVAKVQNQIKRVTGKVNPKDLQVFTRQLATLLASGIPVMQSLEALGKNGSDKQALYRAVLDIVDQLSKGRKLNEAFADYPTVFDKFYVNMMRAGEESGNLDQILSRLAVYIEKSVKIQGKIKGAMLYPVVIMVVASVVVVGILVGVIPKFKTLFDGAGQDLPELTQWVIGASNFLQNQWYILIAVVVGAFFGIKAYYATPGGQYVLDELLLKLPVMGDLIKKGAVAKFTRTLSTLLGSGVSIMESLDIASKVVGNVVIEKGVGRCRDAVAEGKSLTVPLAKEPYMPPMVVQMIGVGEQTGNLDSMLSKVADFYEDEVDVAVEALTKVMEPLLMVVLGIIVGVLVIAMYLPIFKLASTVTG